MLFLSQNEIRNCIVCDYSLEGAHTAVRRCSECGMRYDQCTRILRHPTITFADRVIHLLPTVGLLAACAAPWNWGIRVGLLVAAAGIFLGPAGPRGWRFLLRKPYSPFAVLTSEGVVLGWTGLAHTARTIPWTGAAIRADAGMPQRTLINRISAHLRDLSHCLDSSMRATIWREVESRTGGAADRPSG